MYFYTIFFFFFVQSSVLTDEYTIDKCSEMVEVGVWFPDINCAKDSLKNEEIELSSLWNKLSKSQKKEHRLEQQKWTSAKNCICNNLTYYNTEKEFNEYRKFACLYSFTTERNSQLSTYLEN